MDGCNNMDFPNMEHFHFDDLINFPDYGFAVGDQTASPFSSGLNSYSGLGFTGQFGPLDLQSLSSPESSSGLPVDAFQLPSGGAGNFAAPSQSVGGAWPNDLYISSSASFSPYAEPDAGYGTIAQYQSQSLPLYNAIADAPFEASSPANAYSNSFEGPQTRQDFQPSGTYASPPTPQDMPAQQDIRHDEFEAPATGRPVLQGFALANSTYPLVGFFFFLD
jgi:hypothetical protein